jgi:hypothetical protein
MTHKFASILIALLTLCAQPIAAQQTATKTFVKTIHTFQKGTVELNLPGDVDIKTWEGTSIKVEMTINLPSGSNGMLSELANVGRYNIAAKPEGEVLEVTMPNMARTVKVKGALLRENLSFVVFMPKDLKVEMLNTTDLLAAEKK